MDAPQPARGVPPVRPMRAEDTEAAAAAITAGFADNELWSWMVPDPERRRTLDRYHRSTIAALYLPRAACWISADGHDAALWAPPGTWRLTPREQLAELWPLVRWAGPRAVWRGMKLDGLFSRHHPRRRHWYLSVLAVDPPLQRRGYGSALIAPGLERADREPSGVWLETQRYANVPYYQRFGFELVREVQLDGGPSAWLMWREPR